MFTRELARRLEGTDIITHCFHPGVVRTRFGSGASGLVWLFWPIFRVLMINAKRGAKTGLHLALSEDAGSSTGQFWSSLKRRKGNRHARNDDNAAQLWEKSEEMIDVRK